MTEFERWVRRAAVIGKAHRIYRRLHRRREAARIIAARLR